MAEIYMKSRQHAQAHDELALWRESRDYSRQCANAISQAISDSHRDNHFHGDFVQPVIEAFGMERIAWVLANTIQCKDYDGRFSHAHKQWARNFDFPDSREDSIYFICNAHPYLLDYFIQVFLEKQQALTDRPKIKDVLQSIGAETAGKGHNTENANIERQNNIQL